MALPNGPKNNTRTIGVSDKQFNVPQYLIVDGQQRLTSLYAVFTGHPIITEDYKESVIRIAFRPLDGKFEVTDAAIERDPEYLKDISEIWSSNSYTVAEKYLARLQSSKEVADEEKSRVHQAFSKLENLKNYVFASMVISSTVDVEQVSDIFVRINSKGESLNESDFILTLLSVFWEDGRKELEEFCRRCMLQPKIGDNLTPYNNIIQPSPDQMLRVCVGLGFRRAQLRHVYSILRGKDLETGDFSPERRDAQFNILRDAQAKTLDLNNWKDFQAVLKLAGFSDKKMITSNMSVVYSYLLFLIGRYNCKIDYPVLRSLIARWFFMASLTGRYTSSPESKMESDLAKIRNIGEKNPTDFISTLEQIIRDEFTEDYWNITLVNALETSSARTPVLSAYTSSLKLLNAKVLFSDMKVSDLIDITGRKSAIERHHLFPRAYLKNKLKIIDIREVNQIANLAFVEWRDNDGISDKSPAEYVNKYYNKYKDELNSMKEWHALPEGWENMVYNDFLNERRKLIAKIIRKGFESIPTAYISCIKPMDKGIIL
jgi:hypothetical protein